MKPKLLILFAIAIVACTSESTSTKQGHTKQSRPSFVKTSFKKAKGNDCDKLIDERENCADIDLEFFVVEEGPEALEKSVQDWSLPHLISLLSNYDSNPNTLEEASEVFFTTHESYKGSVMYGAFEANTSANILFADDKYTTLAISGYAFQGGAHASTSLLMATFNNKIGKQLAWDDIVTDTKALETIIEKRFRQERTDMFQNGFDFDETFGFQLPKNFGLVEDGIELYFEAYEVAPYSMGSTAFFLSYDEIDHIKKGALVKSVPKPEKAMAKAIHGFYKWYDEFRQDEARNIYFTKEENGHLVLDDAKLNAYLGHVNASGFISEGYVEKEIAFFKACEKSWKNEPLDEPSSCLDYDRFTCMQDDFDLLKLFFTSAPVEVISNEGSKAIVLLLDEGMQQKFDLVKEANQWKIEKIYCE